jgi:hypothetical protein
MQTCPFCDSRAVTVAATTTAKDAQLMGCACSACRKTWAEWLRLRLFNGSAKNLLPISA